MYIQVVKGKHPGGKGLVNTLWYGKGSTHCGMVKGQHIVVW